MSGHVEQGIGRFRGDDPAKEGSAGECGTIVIIVGYIDYVDTMQSLLGCSQRVSKLDTTERRRRRCQHTTRLMKYEADRCQKPDPRRRRWHTSHWTPCNRTSCTKNIDSFFLRPISLHVTAHPSCKEVRAVPPLDERRSWAESPSTNETLRLRANRAHWSDLSMRPLRLRSPTSLQAPPEHQDRNHDSYYNNVGRQDKIDSPPRRR
jgi:hypothetical protein